MVLSCMGSLKHDSGEERKSVSDVTTGLPSRKGFKCDFERE